MIWVEYDVGILGIMRVFSQFESSTSQELMMAPLYSQNARKRVIDVYIDTCHSSCAMCQDIPMTYL